MVGADERPRWADRPREEAALFNPAFLAEIVVRATSEWEKARPSALPLALAYLIVPVALHPGMRDVLPRRADTAFGTWIVTHQHLLVHVPRRALSLKPATREAVMFGAQVGALAFEAPGLRIGARAFVLATGLSGSDQEADDVRRCAGLMGRWLAAQPRTAGVLQAFGVRL